MNEFDAVIIGAGLAGLHSARLLARSGISVLLVDRKHDLSKGVHITGIFVRRTFEDFHFPAGKLGASIRDVTLYSPRLKSLELKSDKDEFRVGKMGELYRSVLDECLDAGVEFANKTRYISAEPMGERSVVKLEKGGQVFTVLAKVLVGADGAVSRVARDLGLDENAEWIVGYEEVFRSVPNGAPRLHCFLDAELAPGYIAWIADDGSELHVGVGGYTADFEPRSALSELKKKASFVCDLKGKTASETRGGRIPVSGILRRISNERGLLIGDAAGAVSPLTAGGLDPCLRLTTFAAEVIAERVRSDDPNSLRQYSGDLFRTRFVSRLWMRRALAGFKSQSLIELGFRFLNTKIGARFASHVFFGRGSFPDVSDLVSEGGKLRPSERLQVRG